MLRRSFVSLTWLGGTASTPSLGVDTRSAHGQFVNIIAEGTQSRRTQSGSSGSVNPAANASALFAPEIRNAVVASSRVAQPKARSSKWNRALRADLYDELLKLPLRFAIHDFDVLQRHLSNNLSTRSYVQSLKQQQQQGGGQRASAAGSAEEDADSGVYTFSSQGDDEHAFYAVAGRVSAVGYAPPLGPADPLDTIPFFVHRSSNGSLPGHLQSMNARNLMPAFVLKIENSVEGDLFRFEEELMKIFPTKKIFVRSHCIYLYNVGKDGLTVLHHWLLGLGF